jgi:hypothetical protein
MISRAAIADGLPVAPGAALYAYSYYYFSARAETD